MDEKIAAWLRWKQFEKKNKKPQSGAGRNLSVRTREC